LTIVELERKCTDIEARVAKIEDCLRDMSRRHQRFSEAVNTIRKETLSQTDAQEELGD
jgi:hypothetical protein